MPSIEIQDEKELEKYKHIELICPIHKSDFTIIFNFTLIIKKLKK